MDLIVLNVPQQQAGAILGPGGTRVSGIRQETSAYVKIEQGRNGVFLRRVEIKGQNAVAALKEVLIAIEESEKNNEDVELQLLINSNHAGCVIGPQGQTIQGIREAHPKVRVQMDKNFNHEPERAIHVTGPPKSVGASILNFVDVIEEGIQNGQVQKGQSPAPKQNDKKRPRTNSINTETFGTARPSMMSSGTRQHQQRYSEIPAHGGMRIGEGGKTQGNMTCTISNEQAGKLIGKGGRTIHAVRQKCGCKIELEQGEEQRVLRVTGPLYQIEEACRVLSMYLE